MENAGTGVQGSVSTFRAPVPASWPQRAGPAPSCPLAGRDAPHTIPAAFLAGVQLAEGFDAARQQAAGLGSRGPFWRMRARTRVMSSSPCWRSVWVTVAQVLPSVARGRVSADP